MQAGSFIRLLKALVQWDEWFGLEFFDNKVVKFTVIISGITKEDTAFFLSVYPNEFFSKALATFPSV